MAGSSAPRVQQRLPMTVNLHKHTCLGSRKTTIATQHILPRMYGIMLRKAEERHVECEDRGSLRPCASEKARSMKKGSRDQSLIPCLAEVRIP